MFFCLGVLAETETKEKDKGTQEIESPASEKSLLKNKDPQTKLSEKKVPASPKQKKKASSTSSTMPSLLKLATNSASPKKKSKLTLKRKLSGKGESLDESQLKCKFCDFVGASKKHLAGHMNVHKFKRPRLNLTSKSAT